MDRIAFFSVFFKVSVRGELVAIVERLFFLQCCDDPTLKRVGEGSEESGWASRVSDRA